MTPSEVVEANLNRFRHNSAYASAQGSVVSSSSFVPNPTSLPLSQSSASYARNRLGSRTSRTAFARNVQDNLFFEVSEPNITSGNSSMIVNDHISPLSIPKFAGLNLPRNRADQERCMPGPNREIPIIHELECIPWGQSTDVSQSVDRRLQSRWKIRHNADQRSSNRLAALPDQIPEDQINLHGNQSLIDEEDAATMEVTGARQLATGCSGCDQNSWRPAEGIATVWGDQLLGNTGDEIEQVPL